MNKSISQVCREAADLIRTEGFVRGNGGWRGIGGWCIEGALGRVMGIQEVNTNILSAQVNQSAAGQAVRAHLGLPVGRPLMSWNDGVVANPHGYHVEYRSADEVIRVLEEVAEEDDQMQVEKVHRLRDAVAKVGAALYNLTGVFTSVKEEKPVLAWNPEESAWVPVTPVVPDFVPDDLVPDEEENLVSV